MEFTRRTVALYGRFSPGVRDRLADEIGRRGGFVSRDLTRRTEALVIGALATALVDSGALGVRLAAARAQGAPVWGERAFAAELAGQKADGAATLPLTTALAQTQLSGDDAELLAAFDLIALEGGRCRFGDAGVLRTAAELLGHGRPLGDVVQILKRARDLAPVGRHKIVLTAAGEAALQWDDGLTSLEGQGYLALDEAHATLEELFEAAAIAEADGEFDEAARLYDMCARGDRKDAIAPYNFANIRLAQGTYDEAALGYQRALARDPAFAEARYNLAQALEAAGKGDAAAEELVRVLDADPRHPDAVFNLAQLRMQAGEVAEAKRLYERYLALNPPADWAATARKAIVYCQARMAS
ncbi:MAG TPA: tetratricopeptide repeat protein [Caulobacteraceae bacterium]|jgi:tetratricopeptide (TPR) repeat protein